MGIIRRDSQRNGQVNAASKTSGIEYDCSSEPFTKPMLCSLMNIMKTVTFSKKQNVTFKYIIGDLATQLDRVTTKVFGELHACSVVDDLSLEECQVFIIRWSKELKSLRSKHTNHLGKCSSVNRFERNQKCLNKRKDQMHKLTEAQKDLLWFIHILKSLPKSSVCQEECATIELLKLYKQWKKGQLISMLPIMNFIMETLLHKKDCILKLVST